MNVLFVHGMGRSPLSGWPMLRHLRHAGFQTHSLGYLVSLESFDDIRARLLKRITSLAEQGDYLLIGHSLGGILIRAALQAAPEGLRPPHHVFLLGSPVRATVLARHLQHRWWFRCLTGDCGQLLASDARMAALAPLNSPRTSVIGTRDLQLTRRFFGGEPNDGVVSLSEVSATWLPDQVRLHMLHSILPASRRVSQIVIERVNTSSEAR